MTLNALQARASQCELTAGTNGLTAYELESKTYKGADAAVLVSAEAFEALSNNDFSNPNMWRGLSEAIWSEHTPVKVLSYRILHNLRSEPWAQDLMDQIYLEEADLEWAKEGLEDESNGPGQITKDSNGTQLLEGDSVTLIKDLVVKGAGFTAKRGTLVKNIKLTENPKHIEGRVDGIQIVLISDYLKKV